MAPRPAPPCTDDQPAGRALGTGAPGPGRLPPAWLLEAEDQALATLPARGSPTKWHWPWLFLLGPLSPHLLGAELSPAQAATWKPACANPTPGPWGRGSPSHQGHCPLCTIECEFFFTCSLTNEGCLFISRCPEHSGVSAARLRLQTDLGALGLEVPTPVEDLEQAHLLFGTAWPW